MLQLCNAIVAQDKRVDLIELTVEGDSNSVSRAVAQLQFWCQPVESAVK